MERSADTRKKLLEATYQLISEKGYLGATTREIAARAGVSELTLFRKFGKKELLFEEMLKALDAGQQLKDEPYFVCPVCGYTVGGEAPEKCPVCGTLGDKFKRVE